MIHTYDNKYICKIKEIAQRTLNKKNCVYEI